MSRVNLEPIIAHGARMSWVGLLRAGNEFPRSAISRRGVMTPTSAAPLKRCFGLWSDRHGRFVSNLSTPKLTVRILEEGEETEQGVQCIVHWVDRGAFLNTGPNSVCAGDGWPVDLWNSILSEVRTSASLAEGVYALLAEPASRDSASVREWRSAVDGTSESVTAPSGWLPVAVELVNARTSTACFLSYAPGAPFVASLSDAMQMAGSVGRSVDRRAQAIYYLECTLAQLHGVQFGADDFLRDAEFETSSEVRGLRSEFLGRENRYLASPGYGILGNRGHLDS